VAAAGGEALREQGRGGGDGRRGYVHPEPEPRGPEAAVPAKGRDVAGGAVAAAVAASGDPVAAAAAVVAA